MSGGLVGRGGGMGEGMERGEKVRERGRTPGSLRPQSPHLGGLPRFFRCW